ASLIAALQAHGSRALTIICNTPGVGPTSPQRLAQSGQIRKLIASFAAYPTRPTPVEAAIKRGEIALELVPQGTLVERVRAGGAGLAAFYTPTSVGTEIARGKEERVFNGRRYVLETALRADFAVIRAARADRNGNLIFRGAGRNFHPIFATAARVTIAEVDEIVEPGMLDPEQIVTPGIFVDRVVRCERPLDVQAIRELSRRYGKQWDIEVRRRTVGPQGIPPDLMARKAARLLRRGEYVNLGLGLPTLISNCIDPADDITLHSENGMLGFGPLVMDGSEDVDLYNASGQLVRLQPGASFFHSSDAFAMARSGRVTTVVLGGFQVSAAGDLANWNVPATGVGGIGGAMDLAAGGTRIVVVMFHLTREGASKLVERCSYPLTAIGCVATIVTDLAVIDVDRDGFLLRELAPGVGADEVRQVTAAALRVAADIRPMDF
ncbi:MAG TPA: 3-oxoacid CoA-transferase subunit B, partial [Candidatus Kryptonia bacterium]|nr:3-oxoacid CoA-transferase subunit B [Candidatus Kryptonia bacterium]